MNSANVFAEIQLKLLNEGALSTGEQCTCEYVTVLQSFHRGTLSIHWYIAEYFQQILKGSYISVKFYNVHSKIHSIQVLLSKVSPSFKSLSQISATAFAEFIQFGQNPKFRRPRTLLSEEKFQCFIEERFHISSSLIYMYMFHWIYFFELVFPVILVSFQFIKVSIKMQLSEICEKNCGRPVFLEELQAARNFLKVFLHFNKITYSLVQVLQTYSEMCIFVCARKKVLQKQSTKIDLKVPEKSYDEIDDNVMKFILQ